MTQMAVRKALGVSQGTLSQLEGEAASSGQVVEYARLYGVSPDWLATGRGEMKGTTADPTTASIYRLIPRLTQDDRERLNVLLATVVDSGLSLGAFMTWLQERYAPIPERTEDRQSPGDVGDAAGQPAGRSDQTSPAARRRPRLL